MTEHYSNRKMTEHYINEEWLSTVAKIVEFSVEKKIVDNITK
jgi:hypothetical protein